MTRLIGFLIRLALFIALAVWLADRPGTARVVWHGYVIESSAAFLGLCALGVGFVFYLLFRFWHLLRHGPEIWSLGRQLKRAKQGQEHLTRGLVAVAGGNAAEAGRLAVQARKLLGETPATQLLQAQAAQLAGDRGSARAIFRMLAEEPEGAVLGYRGLIMEARRDADWPEVSRLVEELHRIQPKTPWLNLIRFEIAARKQAWEEAGESLAAAAHARLIEPERLRNYRAAVSIANGQAAAQQGRQDEALAYAEQALKQSSGWLPAIINLAQSQAAGGHRRAARRTAEKYWPEHPHPHLAAILRDGDAEPIEAYKQTQSLTRANEDAAESRLALAEAALAVDIWGEARRHLMALISRDEGSQTAFRLMARLERRETGDEQAALQWMTRAANAAPDPAWLCSNCGGAHDQWQASCRHCGSFATLEWRRPGTSRAAAPDTALISSSGWIG